MLLIILILQHLFFFFRVFLAFFHETAAVWTVVLTPLLNHLNTAGNTGEGELLSALLHRSCKSHCLVSEGLLDGISKGWSFLYCSEFPGNEILLKAEVYTRFRKLISGEKVGAKQQTLLHLVTPSTPN